MKRKISLFLTFILMLSTIFSVNVFAASYPSISSGKYIEFKAQQNINVYKDTSCKTRGTSSPSKKYNASISSGDTCYIYKIEKNYIQVNYPTSSGRRTGYIKRNALFDKTAPVNYISSSKAKVTIHKSSSGSCVAKGDKVWEVDTKKEFSGYKAVIYEAKSGKRAYKLGYVTNSDFEKIKNNSSTKEKSSSSKTVVQSSKVTYMKNDTFGLKELLSKAQSAANENIKTVKMVNEVLTKEKALGVATIATITKNPSKLYGIFDEDAAVGVLVMSISEATYQNACSSYQKFISSLKNIKTEEQANKAFEYFVDALSKYNAVIAANIDVVDRYALQDGRSNYRKDALNAYFSSVASSAIPASEYASVVKACEIANTTAEMLDIVESKYSGYSEMKNTRDRWYEQWNKIK